MSLQSSGHAARRHRSQHPHPVDVHVGARVRLRRTVLGMSQEKLGEALGLTFQQVQKYERGTNRIGASRLYELSRVLNVPVGFFFDEFDPALLDRGRGGGLSEAPGPAYDALAIDRDQIEIVRIFQRIGDTAVRRRLIELAKAIGLAYFPGDDA